MKKMLGQNNMPDALVALVGLSNGLHSLIRRLPPALWRMPTLVNHLELMRNEAHKAIPSVEEDEGDDETDVTVTDDPLPQTVPPVCIIFHRMLQAICAWTTGVQYLLKSPMAKNSKTIKLAIVDFPRLPIKEISVDALLTRWTDIAQWPELLRDNIENEIRAEDMTHHRKGAVHCEAGLITSLLHLDEVNAENEAEPEILIKAFKNLSESKLPHGQDITFAIGVAKKCCPICQMLFEILRSEPTNLDVEFAGGHSRFHPWVPPYWLPTSVLETLEKALLQKIAEMVGEGAHLVGSRASSPASINSDQSPPKRFRTTADAIMARLVSE
ncbi:hypothetical protein C8R44DRAFT_62658 [Mycena epipterygia]|nr:hypothetical protein C8R44DRAFT_62658 [Mycena epipterygia]